MNAIPQISEAEYEVMEIIWEHNPISTNEITDKMSKLGNRSDRTIHTLIARLDKKGAIAHTQKGREYIYIPTVKKEDYISCESKSFLKKFYNGAVNKMVMNFIENDMLSPSDIQELKDMLDKH
jgi:BlaI family penicillinase repressor